MDEVVNFVNWQRPTSSHLPRRVREPPNGFSLWNARGGPLSDPALANRMKASPVSSRVNSPKNDDAEIIVPVELQSVARTENQPQLL